MKQLSSAQVRQMWLDFWANKASENPNKLILGVRAFTR